MRKKNFIQDFFLFNFSLLSIVKMQTIKKVFLPGWQTESFIYSASFEEKIINLLFIISSCTDFSYNFQQIFLKLNSTQSLKLDLNREQVLSNILNKLKYLQHQVKNIKKKCLCVFMCVCLCMTMILNKYFSFQKG